MKTAPTPRFQPWKRTRKAKERAMLVRRIVPCLDIKEGRVVKGVRFVNLIDAGDPVELARRYENEGADELVFLDITATVEGRRRSPARGPGAAARIKTP